MKIKTVNMDYEDVLKLPTYKHKNPQKQSAFFRKLICNDLLSSTN